MVSSVWPKTKMRLEQIGLELSLDNDQQASIPGTNTVASIDSDTTPTTSSPSPLVANRLTSLPLSSSGSDATTTTTTSNTTDTDLSARHNLPISRTECRLSGTRTSASMSPMSPSLMSTRINSEFKKNMFFVSPDQPPITTTLPPEEVFEELGVLGSGSSGKVLKMRHKETGKICAVKQMRRTLNDEENKRIYMDLQVVLQCECDNIVRCCGYFIKEAEVWICIELMTTCFDKLLRTRKEPLPEKFLGAIAVSAVNALYYLKEKHNIIHRDVKPSNILINDQGQIKLCDFGISGRLVDSLAKTRAAGCIPYMAPERIEWNSPSYDIRADVWSLGITLFELATGRSPYAECNTDFDMLVRVVNNDPPTLPSNIEFSPELRNFVSACLTKDWNQRPKYKQLLEHEFIKKHMSTSVNLSELGDLSTCFSEQ